MKIRAATLLGTLSALLLVAQLFHASPAAAQQNKTYESATAFVIKNEYNAIDSLLQFLYRVDGNLPAIGASKEK